MLRGLHYVANYILDQKVRFPRRRRAWDAKRHPFIHCAAKELRFELHPPQFIDRYIYAEGAFERRFLEFLDSFLPQRGVMLDVGANIGNHALYMARSFREVHCFDPNPMAVAKLRRNVELNHAANITIHEVGLGSEDCELPFFVEPGTNLGASHFVAEAGEGTISLPIRAGDAYLASKQIRNVDFVKIDVEGGELEVLRGLQETIRRDRPIITFEHHGQTASAAIFDKLQSLGYDIFDLVYPDTGTRIEKFVRTVKTAGMPELKQIHMPEARTYENLLAVPH